MKMQLPFFPGFYNSRLGYLIDSEIEQRAENGEAEPAEGYNYAAVHLALCEVWLDALNDELGTSLALASLWSPREYNFTSDKITIEVNPEDTAKLEAMRGSAEFRRVLVAELTPRYGFCPYYDSDESAEEWQRPLAEWDEPQTSLLIQAFIESETGIDSTGDLAYNLLSGPLDYAFGEAVANNL